MTPNQITNYKAKVASRYQVVAPDEIAAKIMEADYYLASEKHDGFFGMLEVKGGAATLYGRSGDVLNVPKITGAATTINKDVILAGEICCFIDGVSGSHREVSSAISDPQKGDLRFGVFDVVEYEGSACQLDPKEKDQLIASLTGKTKEIFRIEQHIFDSRKDIISFYQDTVKHAEGVVVRSATGLISKIKPVITLDMVVMGYAEASGERAGLLRDLLVGFADESGGLQIIAKVGTGFSMKDRETIIARLEPMKVESEYTEVSSAKTAFVMVKPELVVEISCLDLINESSSGAIQRPMLDYDERKGYAVRGLYNALSVIGPSLIRFRTDKKPIPSECGYLQIANYIKPSPQVSHELDHEASTIIKREVYVKAGKDGKAVRKILAIKTNKEETGKYAPYIVYYTDFSAGRKSPLDQDIYLCMDEESVTKKMNEIKEENIKKGWALV